jgi:hypothetical protein
MVIYRLIYERASGLTMLILSLILSRQINSVMVSQREKLTHIQGFGDFLVALKDCPGDTYTRQN